MSNVLPSPLNYGYRFDIEDRVSLHSRGRPPYRILNELADVLPDFNARANPLDVFDILDQGEQGACQGHSLAGVFSVCYFLATGRRAAFSRACGYYESQRKDGIKGDNGSTLSAGQWVATEHGMCLESEWPYPRQYDPARPTGVQFWFRLQSTRPMDSSKEIFDWLSAGLPVQTGLMWGPSCDREIVDDYRGGQGGHSTMLWQLTDSGNARDLNSWGSKWNGDGMHEFTPRAIEQMVRGKWNEFIGYAPTGMEYPEAEPI